MTVGQFAVEEWIAVAGIAAGIVGTLLGTLLGARLSADRERATRRALEHRDRRGEVEHALTRADLALADLDPDTLVVGLVHDRGLNLDRTAETLATLQEAERLAAAREALALVRVRHPNPDVRDAASTLARDLVRAQHAVTGWFRATVVDRRIDAAALADSHADATAALRTAAGARDRLADLAAT